MERQRVHSKVKNGGQAQARPVVGGEPCPGCGPHAAGGYGSAFVLVVLLVLFARAVPVWAAPPQITSETAFTVDEGSTDVTTLTATDLENDPLTWSIPTGGGAGWTADAFSLTAAGVLTFTAAPDYETPTDDDEDNVYAVTVEVSDGANTDTAALEVTVTNVAEGVPNIVHHPGRRPWVRRCCSSESAVPNPDAEPGCSGASRYDVSGRAYAVGGLHPNALRPVDRPLCVADTPERGES